MKGKLRVRIMCSNCGYIESNGTTVYMHKGLLNCSICHKPDSMCAIVELPDGTIAPAQDIKLSYKVISH